MASLKERISIIQKYFYANWTATPFDFDGKKPELDTSNLTSYIRFSYANYDNQVKGMGREIGYGTLTVYCYHKVRIQSAILSDEVNTFFKCKDLDLNIRSDIGIQGATLDLDNDFYLTTMQFDISQYA